MTIWEILGISQTTDQKQIKKVYAARVKNCHREEKPEEWAVLHDAYQRAIQYAKRQEKESDLNGSRTVPSPVKPVAREGLKERDGALEKEYDSLKPMRQKHNGRSILHAFVPDRREAGKC